MRRHSLALVIIAVSMCLAAGPASQPSLSASPVSNALLGLPSPATTKVTNKNDFLLVKPFFVTSYNSEKGTPNWVSWVLTKDDLGDAARKRIFDTDTTLPIGFRRIKTKDYINSGFDRGHLCPHSDRAANEEMSYSTFIMTNIIPQAPNVNQKAWAQLEDYERRIAALGNHVYISAGPVGQGGVGKTGPAQIIGGEHSVTVPAKCWKIIVVVPEAGGLDDLAKINSDTRVLSVLMPNDEKAVSYEWKQYRVSVDVIEEETGLKFFGRLKPDVATMLKMKVDDAETPRPEPRQYGEHDGG